MNGKEDGRVERQFREIFGSDATFREPLPKPLAGIDDALLGWHTHHDVLTSCLGASHDLGYRISRIRKRKGPVLRVGPIGEALTIQRLIDGGWAVSLDSAYRGNFLTQLVDRAMRQRLAAY